jgi:hypothetical protein
MRRTVGLMLATLAGIAGTSVVATPAQAYLRCDQHAVANGRYNKCWDPYGSQYRTEIWCRRGDRPAQTYWYPGPWRNFGGTYASVATCPSGDYFTGDWQLNFAPA